MDTGCWTFRLTCLAVIECSARAARCRAEGARGRRGAGEIARRKEGEWAAPDDERMYGRVPRLCFPPGAQLFKCSILLTD